MLFILSGFSQLRFGCLVLISKDTAVNTERALQRLTQFTLGLIQKEVPTGNACLPPLQRILASKFLCG